MSTINGLTPHVTNELTPHTYEVKPEQIVGGAVIWRVYIDGQQAADHFDTEAEAIRYIAYSPKTVQQKT